MQSDLPMEPWTEKEKKELEIYETSNYRTYALGREENTLHLLFLNQTALPREQFGFYVSIGPDRIWKYDLHRVHVEQGVERTVSSIHIDERNTGKEFLVPYQKDGPFKWKVLESEWGSRLDDIVEQQTIMECLEGSRIFFSKKQKESLEERKKYVQGEREHALATLTDLFGEEAEESYPLIERYVKDAWKDTPLIIQQKKKGAIGKLAGLLWHTFDEGFAPHYEFYMRYQSVLEREKMGALAKPATSYQKIKSSMINIVSAGARIGILYGLLAGAEAMWKDPSKVETVMLWGLAIWLSCDIVAASINSVFSGVKGDPIMPVGILGTWRERRSSANYYKG